MVNILHIVYLYVRTYVCMYLCTSVSMCVCMYMYNKVFYVYNTVGVDIKNTFTPSYESDLTSSDKVAIYISNKITVLM